MKKTSFLLVAVWWSLAINAHAIPKIINYQGTLKEQKAPVTGLKHMVFQITNETGLDGYSVAIDTIVNVDNGLFSVPLEFEMHKSWESIRPYLKVVVEGQEMNHPEPVNASVYSLMSDSVVDKAITLPKLNPEVQQYLVPAGAILMFADQCPSSGWTEFAGLRGKFPVGADASQTFAVGFSSGSLTHSHKITLDGAHNHGGWTTAGDAGVSSGAGSSFTNQAGWHRHQITTDGEHDHGGHTGNTSTLPPYLSVVFCRKD